MPTLTNIQKGSELHQKLVKELDWRIRMSENAFSDARTRWAKAENQVLAYLPEREADRDRKEVRDTGLPQYTTIQIPYSYAVMMTMHTYLASVFMTRSPIMQFQGWHGETQQQEQAVEALTHYQVYAGKMLPQMYTWLYDACKYGAGICGVYWDEQTKYISSIEEVPDEFGGSTSALITKVIPGYKGNKLYNVSPKNFLYDPRVSFRDFQKGEFCIVRNRVSWSNIVLRESGGFYTNVEHIPSDHKEDFNDQFNESNLVTPTTNTQNQSDGFGWGHRERKHPSILPVYECYVEVIPKEWGLSESQYPEKWVFTLTGDLKLLLGAQPLGLYHGEFPFCGLEIEPDALALVNRGIPEILNGVQETVDWLVNAHFFNVRAAINNQFVVDPSRVVMKDLLDPMPGGIIRLKSTAYGSDVRAAISQLPVADVTRTHIQDMQVALGIGERVMGINDQMMGMLAGGGRKTATEVRTSSSFGIGRAKIVAESMSGQGWGPLATMVLQNSQQMYDTPMKLRLVGNLANEIGQQFFNVDPSSIAGSYEFVPVDGTLPVDRMAQVALWKDLFGQMRAFPQVMMEYDWPKLFGFVAKLAGLRNIDQFKVEVAPDMKLMAQMQAGNLIPMGGKGNGGGSPPARPSAGNNNYKTVIG